MTNQDAAPESDISVPQAKQPIFPLPLLPRELRDEIYIHSISAGDLAILRLNKRTYTEASSLISKHGVLRINRGFADSDDDRTVWSNRDSSQASLVQNLDLRLNATAAITDILPIHLENISRLFDPKIPRGLCRVTLICDSGAASYHAHIFRLCVHLRIFGQFEKVDFYVLKHGLVWVVGRGHQMMPFEMKI